jgi:hypothetical protein
MFDLLYFYIVYKNTLLITGLPLFSGYDVCYTAQLKVLVLQIRSCRKTAYASRHAEKS